MVVFPDCNACNEVHIVPFIYFATYIINQHTIVVIKPKINSILAFCTHHPNLYTCGITSREHADSMLLSWLTLTGVSCKCAGSYYECKIFQQEQNCLFQQWRKREQLLLLSAAVENDPLDRQLMNPTSVMFTSSNYSVRVLLQTALASWFLHWSIQYKGCALGTN